ncbi:hypothetical protein [Roseospira marina]|uniref:hypothetical protein n=1 Tax=Roseospira marina TaxID=140057 RepID=UPI00161F29D5|nr:hypothetical protein [Roseospira marina]MBB5088001.1 hypothetical protein [Roseospira marina]
MRNDDRIDMRNASGRLVNGDPRSRTYEAAVCQAADVLRTSASADGVRGAEKHRLNRIAAFLDSLSKQ